MGIEGVKCTIRVGSGRLDSPHCRAVTRLRAAPRRDSRTRVETISSVCRLRAQMGVKATNGLLVQEACWMDKDKTETNLRIESKED